MFNKKRIISLDKRVRKLEAFCYSIGWEKYKCKTTNKIYNCRKLEDGYYEFKGESFSVREKEFFEGYEKI